MQCVLLNEELAGLVPLLEFRNMGVGAKSLDLTL
jgi:hypothetical protein